MESEEVGNSEEVLQIMIASVTGNIKIFSEVHLEEGGRRAERIYEDLENLIALAKGMLP